VNALTIRGSSGGMQAVPEPSMFALLLSMLAAGVFLRRSRTKG
jgi:hypothetical protein